jgi:hypothetical protein
LATITGSTTSGTAGARASRQATTVAMTSAECSMPVLMQSAPMSASTTSICCAMKAGGTSKMPCTPVVSWAVSAVTAVAP